MACLVRLMRREDVAQVTAIDREAFPTMWPPPNYERELSNQLAHYIVVCDDAGVVEAPPAPPPVAGDTSGPVSRLRQFLGGCFRGRDHAAGPAGGQQLLGFAGFWIMAGEVHITSIAVREEHRGQGIGERLLISLIDLAVEQHGRLMTLEVRASNTVAQRLYAKYGFDRVGVRRGYYTDNREDGVIMTTADITAASFQERLERLRRAHARRWGVPLNPIGR
ncbi:MAG: ribosomal protein S18-alanine N-acetyltransferase [Chloroflexota bacterium]